MNINKDFPVNSSMIYFDNAATSLTAPVVAESLVDYYQSVSANINRANYKEAVNTTKLFNQVREKTKQYINAESDNEIIFTSGVTASLNMIANDFLVNELNPGDEIIISLTEHASNVLPWFKLANKHGIVIKYVPLTTNGEVTVDNLKAIITNNTKVVALAHVTNTIGDQRDIKKIANYLKGTNIIFIVDGAQAVSHLNIDVQNLGVDFYVFSAHKMYGPNGVGILYGQAKWLSKFNPSTIGGGSSLTYHPENSRYTLKSFPYSLEAGTQNIPGIIAFGKTIDYIKSNQIMSLTEHVLKLKEYLVSELKLINGIIIYNEAIVGTTVLFNHEDYFCEDVAMLLAKHNIAVRAGDHCSKMISGVIGTNNTVRISLAFYNTKEQVDTFIKVIKDIENIYKEIL